MKRIINMICLMLLSTVALWGQSVRPLQNVPTPEAAGLGMYGSIPVGLFTGIPNISVPLHEMKVGSYTFPISVSYHLASVRPNAQEGILGLGWSLLAGGCINRTVREVYDEQMHSNGMAPGYYSHYAKMKDITPERFYNETQNIRGVNSYYELSADEFSFSFGDYSGNFYLNEDGEWNVISDHDIQVIFDANSGFLSVSQLRSNIITNGWYNKSKNQRFFNKFTLVTPDGCRYEFGGADATEYSIPYYARNKSDLTATTWYLTRVTTPEGWNVEYIYEGSGPTCTINYAPSSRVLRGSWGINPASRVRGKNALTGFLHLPVKLKEIQTPNETISLKYSYDHFEPAHIPDAFLSWLDAESGAVDDLFAEHENPADQFHLFLAGNYETRPRDKFNYFDLHAMEIKSKHNPSNCKTYYFKYDHNNRKKLSLVTERTGEYEEITEWIKGGTQYYLKHHIPETPTDYTPKEYHFRYNTSNLMPVVGIAKEDSWGYYKGGVVSITDSPSFDLVSPSSIHTLSEALIEMEFPTKGKVQFDYELHRYSKVVSPTFNSLTNQSGDAGGLRISAVRTLSKDDRVLFTKKYYYTTDKSSATSSGILRNKPVFNLTYHYGDLSLELKSINGFYKPITNMNSPTVGYSCVIEETLDSLGVSQGHIKHQYTNFDTDIWGETHYDEPAIYNLVSGDNYINPYSSKSMERGKLVSEEYFDKDGSPKRSIKHRYATISKGKNRLLTANQYELILNISGCSSAKLGDLTYTYLYSYLPVQSIETSYENGLEWKKEQEFTYTGSKQIRSESVSNSLDNTFITVNYRYPQDLVNDYPNMTISYTWLAYKQMVNRNILNKPVETVKTKGEHVLSATINEYKVSNNKIVPHKVYALETTTPIALSSYSSIRFLYFQKESILDTRMKLKTWYKEFDNYGNPMDINHLGIDYVYLWSYNGQYPIAEIENTTYQEVKTEIEANTVPGINMSDVERADMLRNTLKNAHITTYTYTPAVGITSITDPSRKTTYYEYDSLNRLKEVYTEKGGWKEILESYEYNYANQ